MIRSIHRHLGFSRPAAVCEPESFLPYLELKAIVQGADLRNDCLAPLCSPEPETSALQHKGHLERNVTVAQVDRLSNLTMAKGRIPDGEDAPAPSSSASLRATSRRVSMPSNSNISRPDAPSLLWRNRTAATGAGKAATASVEGCEV